MRPCYLTVNSRQLAWCAMSEADGFFAPIDLETPEYFVASIAWFAGTVDSGAQQYRYGDVVYTWDGLLVESGASDDEFWSRSDAPPSDLAIGLISSIPLADFYGLDRLEIETPHLSSDRVLEAVDLTADHFTDDPVVYVNGAALRLS